MSNVACIAYRLTGLLLLYLLSPTVAWVVLAAGVLYLMGERRRRALRSVSVS
jgi:hypothetical protein